MQTQPSSIDGVCAGAAEADRGRAPRLLPAAGVHSAVEVIHSSVSSPAPTQPGAAPSQPQGGEKVGINTLNKTNTSTLSHMGGWM